MALMKFERTALPEKVSRIGKKVTAKLRTLVCFQVFPRDHGFVNPLSRLSLPSSHPFCSLHYLLALILSAATGWYLIAPPLPPFSPSPTSW